MKLLQKFLTCYKGLVCSEPSPQLISATHPATPPGSALGGLLCLNADESNVYTFGKLPSFPKSRPTSVLEGLLHYFLCNLARHQLWRNNENWATRDVIMKLDVLTSWSDQLGKYPTSQLSVKSKNAIIKPYLAGVPAQLELLQDHNLFRATVGEAYQWYRVHD